MRVRTLIVCAVGATERRRGPGRERRRDIRSLYRRLRVHVLPLPSLHTSGRDAKLIRTTPSRTAAIRSANDWAEPGAAAIEAAAASSSAYLIC